MKLKHKVLGDLTLVEKVPGVAIDQAGRYHPYPAPDGIFVNPPSPRFGQVAQGDVLEFVMRTFLGGAAEPYATNLLHFILTKASGSKTFAAAATGLAKYIFASLAGATGFAQELNSSVTIKNPIVRSLNTSTDEWQGSNSIAGATGGGTGSVPLRSSTVMKKGTGKAGRSFQGRCFLPAVDEVHQRAGVLIAQSVQRENAWAQKLLSFADPDDAGTTYVLGVHSPTQSKKSGSLVVTPCSSVSVHGTIGSQRRRQHID